MAITSYKLAAIKADYEAGIDTKSNIAVKYKINRLSLARNAKKHGWEYGKSNANVTELISKNAAKRIVEEETNKLIDYTTRHLKYTRTLRTLSAVTTSEFSKYVKADKNYSKLKKQEADKLLVIQRTLEVSARTHDLIYKSERLAMGLDQGISGGTTDIDSKVQTRMERIKDAHRQTG